MEFKMRALAQNRNKIIVGSALALAAILFGSSIATHSHAESLQQPILTTPHSESAASKNNAEIISTISKQKQATEASVKAVQEAAQKASDDAKAQSEQASQSSAKAQQSTATSTASSAQSVTTTNTQNTTTQNTASTPAQSTPVDTSGFNFGGHHYPITGFAGTGQVPATNYVYQWDSDPRWFLIEQGGAAGQVIKSLVGMGTAVTVNGHTYHVTDLVGGIPNNGTAYNYYQSHIGQHAIGFQTCDSVGILTLYFAD